MPHLLLTRPQADSERLCAQLGLSGFVCDIAPMLTIAPRQATFPDAEPQAIVITSRHAVLHHDLSAYYHLPLFAVGSASAKAARLAGFTDVREAGGDVMQLSSVLRRSLSVKKGALLYLRGQNISYELKKLLPGFTLIEQIVYDAISTDHLPADITAKLGSYDAIVFYSARSARIFTQCAGDTPLTTACVLSKQVAAALDSAHWQRILTCTRSDTASMITLLQSL